MQTYLFRRMLNDIITQFLKISFISIIIMFIFILAYIVSLTSTNSYSKQLESVGKYVDLKNPLFLSMQPLFKT